MMMARIAEAHKRGRTRTAPATVNTFKNGGVDDLGVLIG